MKKALLLFAAIATTALTLSAAPLHCNPKTKVCHREGSRYYSCKNCTVILEDEKTALQKGYHLAQKGGRKKIK
ncbi:hypothetical protein KAH37_09720 [bacterium]|nr:hypothetical protein [bacterium]